MAESWASSDPRCTTERAISRVFNYDSQAIVEYACHEGNYFMWNSLRGDRQKAYDARVAARSSVGR